MNNLLENVFISREFYHFMLNPICEKFKLTHTEVMILLFLANYPTNDTASDIVNKRHLTKSNVSMALRDLTEKKLVSGEYIDGNHRSVHLKLLDKANSIIEEGNRLQSEFLEVLVRDFSDSDKELLRKYMDKMCNNIRSYYGN